MFSADLRAKTGANGIRRFATRALLAVGGAIAGTAVAWALTTSSATAAETVPSADVQQFDVVSKIVAKSDEKLPVVDPAATAVHKIDETLRTEQQKAQAFPLEGRELLALSAFVARQSRGLPIESSDPRLAPFIEQGRALYTARQGQLNLACAQCHDDNWGQKLAGIPMPQGHPTGYPLYRLEWQTLGSLQRRLRNCLSGIRAEPYPFGAPELVELERYLMWRARGMKVESPAVRP